MLNHRFKVLISDYLDPSLLRKNPDWNKDKLKHDWKKDYHNFSSNKQNIELFKFVYQIF